MLKSQSKYLVISYSLLLIVITSLAEFSSANKTLPSSSSLPAGNVQASSSSTPTTTPKDEDDANGDDGAALKADLSNLNKTGKLDTSQNLYYQPEYIKDPVKAMSYWFDFSTLPLSQNVSTKHEMLSKSHRRAAPIKLSFDFPYYGQPLRNIIIATGGFLYVGEHLHHWLAATQNISPLMANFDLSASNSSDIHYYDNGTALFVQWLDVQMKDNIPPGNFSFQCTLMKNGDIIFVYKNLPVPIQEIPEEDHPVKVGISDAFLIDKVAFFIRRKTIYDYHRLNLLSKNGQQETEIGNKTAIYLKALQTCNQYDTCESCSKAATSLECIWCPAIKRCSSGFDRKRQEWLSSQCDKIHKSDCSIKAAETSVQQSSPSDPLISVESPSKKMQTLPERLPDTRANEGGPAFVTFLMFIALTSGVALWVFYAYKNPHTPSGQMLIKYRPGNWRWQNAETRYTAASIHM